MAFFRDYFLVDFDLWAIKNFSDLSSWISIPDLPFADSEIISGIWIFPFIDDFVCQLFWLARVFLGNMTTHFLGIFKMGPTELTVDLIEICFGLLACFFLWFFNGVLYFVNKLYKRMKALIFSKYSYILRIFSFTFFVIPSSFISAC